jgi:gamma-glutamyl phosphate reductase
MALNLESLSDDEKTALLGRIAHTLTVCARDTYEIGTENVLNPQILRAYNELLHQVIGSMLDRLAGSQESVESTIEMIRSFGTEQDRVEEVDWALKCALQRCSVGSKNF